MYDATVVATFECVELEIQRQLLLHADLENPKNDINIGGFTKDPKSTKRIIGDMSHTYFANYIDSPSGINKLEDIVADLEEKFPDTHFQITPSKNNFGEIQGAYTSASVQHPRQTYRSPRKR